VPPDPWDDRVVTVSVLLIDDDPAFLALGTRVLESMGIEVVATAHDPESGFEAANATRPDAAIVDIGLPEHEGIELAYRLAALPWQPRVVLTSTDTDCVSAIFAAGASKGAPTVPFVPKDQLADGRLRRLLMPE
jgi:DNA-binding NarL/FixJ family response regulator